MAFLPAFLLRILKAASGPEAGQGVTYMTIRRPYANLEAELRRAFEGEEKVKFIVDRRYRERRMSQQPVPAERRRGDRRTPKEELVQAVMSV